MADNYLEFSEVIPKLRKPEEAWLKEQLQPVCVFGDKEYPAGDNGMPLEVTPETSQQDPTWQGPRFLRDKDDYDPKWDCLGFHYAFQDDHDPKGWGCHLWLYTEECGDIGHVAHLVRKFLKKFRPSECWALTWASTCSKPRVGEFGGGAVFVTADRVYYDSAYDFVAKKRQAFEANKKAPRQKRKST